MDQQSSTAINPGVPGSAYPDPNVEIRNFTDTVADRMVSDPTFAKSVLVDDESELIRAYDALKKARDGLKLWNMDISFIDEILGPDNAPESVSG